MGTGALAPTVGRRCLLVLCFLEAGSELQLSQTFERTGAGHARAGVVTLDMETRNPGDAGETWRA